MHTVRMNMSFTDERHKRGLALIGVSAMEHMQKFEVNLVTIADSNFYLWKGSDLITNIIIVVVVWNIYVIASQ